MRLFKQKTSGKWWCDFSTSKGKRIRKSTGMTDSKAANQEAARLQREAEHEAAGLTIHREARKAGLPALIDQFEIHLRRKGNTEKHTMMTVRTLHRLLDPIRSIEDATDERIELALDEIRAARSGRTFNQFRWCVRSFFKWLRATKKWSEDPTANINPKHEYRTRRRRAATEDEARLLLARAPSDRALVYRVALGTGLRRGELAGLRWCDLDLEIGAVVVRDRISKNSEETALPLEAEVIEALRAARGDAGHSERVFRSVPQMRTFRKDLAAAEIEYETPDGVLDFHALRTTMVTWCDLNGVPLAEAQQLARHSTPLLTSNYYTRLRVENLRRAVNKIGLGDSGQGQSSMPSSMPQTGPNAAESCVTARNAAEAAGRRKAAS